MTSREGDLTWLFIVPTLARPTGGHVAMFEIANALARAGRDQVQLVHVPCLGERIRALAEVRWFDFDPAVSHRFNADLDPSRLPDADVVVYSTQLLATALSPHGGSAGERLVDALRGIERDWLPTLFLQGHGVFGPDVEDLAVRLPGPKVCVGAWLADLLVREGAPAADVVHIPNGIDPRTFRITRPIGGRPPRVAMNFDPHPGKGGEAGLAAIEQLHRRLAVPGTVFGTRLPSRGLPAGLTAVASPDRVTLAEDIYSAASVFLQPSRREGFGLCAVEAMACGCALVTTANGGSADYAFDGETAVVCGDDASEMADALEDLVADDARRIRLATEGSRFVERYRWSTTAERLRDLVSGRLARGRRS